FLPPEEPPYNEGGYGGQDVKNLAHRSADQEFSVLGGVVLDDREDPEVTFPAAAATEAEQRRVDVAVVFGTVRVVEELHLTHCARNLILLPHEAHVVVGSFNGSAVAPDLERAVVVVANGHVRTLEDFETMQLADDALGLVNGT